MWLITCGNLVVYIENQSVSTCPCWAEQKSKEAACLLWFVYCSSGFLWTTDWAQRESSSSVLSNEENVLLIHSLLYVTSVQTVCLKGLWDKISHADNVTEGAIGCVCVRTYVCTVQCVCIWKSTLVSMSINPCTRTPWVTNMKDGDTVFSVSANQSSSCAVVIPLLQIWHWKDPTLLAFRQ